MPQQRSDSSGQTKQTHLSGRRVGFYRPVGSPEVRRLIDDGFQAFNAARLSEACRIFTEKMLDPAEDTTIGLTMAGALTPAGLGGCVVELMDRGLVDFIISTGANLYHDLHHALNFTLHRGSPFVDDVELHEQGIVRIYDVLFPADGAARDRRVRARLPVRASAWTGRCRPPSCTTGSAATCSSGIPGREAHSILARAAAAGVPIYTSSPGDSSIGMNLASHELLNGSTLMIDPSRDVNEVCAIVLAGRRNGCVILGGGSPKNFYLQAQPTLWEVYGIPKGGNDYFIQITTDQVVWGGLSGATPVGGGQLGQGESRRAAGHGRGLLRLHDRVPAVLRVRGRVGERPAAAQGPGAPARRPGRRT